MLRSKIKQGLSHKNIGMGEMRAFRAKVTARCVPRTETYQHIQSGWEKKRVMSMSISSAFLNIFSILIQLQVLIKQILI